VARADPADTPGRGALWARDALVRLLRAHTKPANGPAADQGIRPTVFSLRARHAHGHELGIPGSRRIRPHQTRQPRRIVHAHAARYHDGGVERHAASVAGIGHRNLRGLLWPMAKPRIAVPLDPGIRPWY